MADRPIIFSAPMVRALLDGRKTQTRRVLKPQPTEQPAANCHPAHKPRHPAPYLDAYCGEPRTSQNPRGQGRDWHWWQVDDRCGPVACRVPYAPGDRLWVREAFCPRFGYPAPIAKPHYRADDDRPEWRRVWKPSIHMPRWASRLTLNVTDVRVERLQDISREDAIAEGIQRVGGGMLRWENWSGAEGQSGASPQAAYALLWNSLHGPGAWDANPWVVALTFDVVRGTIDQMPGVAGC